MQDLDLTSARILLLDGETRAGLAIVRSLGQIGCEIAVASHENRAIAQSSKYASATLRCPNPNTHPEMYLKWLLLTLEQYQPNVVLPISDLSLTLTLQHEEAIREVTVLPCVEREIFEAVADKFNLMQVAESLGVRAPKTLLLNGEERWNDSFHQQLSSVLPGVMKAQHSAEKDGKPTKKTEVYYVKSVSEVREALQDAYDNAERVIPFLLQEEIKGQGVGVFALCRQGEILLDFAHQRLLEKPPSGGRSVLCQGLAPEHAPFEEAKKLLKHFNWNGVAMVEFKRDSSGNCVLMEINPRFWGSLQLAISSGRDFPRHLLELSIAPDATSTKLKAETTPYSYNKRLRWLLGTLDHSLIRLKKSPLSSLKDIFTKNALQLFKLGTRTQYDVFRLGDIRPFAREVFLYLKAILP